MAEVVLAAVLILLLATGGFLYSRRRKSDAPERTSEPSQPPSVDLDQAEVVTITPLPNDRSEALAIGSEEAIAALERGGLIDRPDPSRGGPMANLLGAGTSLVGGGSTLGAVRRTDSGRVVELTEQSFKELQKFGPVLDKAGNQLGIVRNKHAINSIVRFKPAAATSVVAVNPVAMAVAVAVLALLANVERQLKELQKTLDRMIKENERKRVATVLAANKILEDIAKGIERRGEMTNSDLHRLDTVAFPTTTAQYETELALSQMLDSNRNSKNRDQRRREIKKLLDDGLEHWLAVRVEAELALTREELLRLHWESTQHADSAEALADETCRRVEARQERLMTIGQILRDLSDPEARTGLDFLRFLDARHLAEKQAEINDILAAHQGVFGGPASNSFSLTDPKAEAVVLELTASDPRSD